MSISERIDADDFSGWIAEEFAAHGSFTALVVLFEIADDKIKPLASTYLNVLSADVDWSEMTVMFAGAGTQWGAAAFFPVTASQGGPIDSPNARLRLRDLEDRISANKRVPNEGHVFDSFGNLLEIEEMGLR